LVDKLEHHAVSHLDIDLSVAHANTTADHPGSYHLITYFKGARLAGCHHAAPLVGPHPQEVREHQHKDQD
jgi:hypothetical protein